LKGGAPTIDQSALLERLERISQDLTALQLTSGADDRPLIQPAAWKGRSRASSIWTSPANPAEQALVAQLAPCGARSPKDLVLVAALARTWWPARGSESCGLNAGPPLALGGILDMIIPVSR
jgi:hypothetical protein